MGAYTPRTKTFSWGPRVAGATPRISEAYLEPVLEHMLRQFPFRILGFQTGNGAEFINRMVARLLEKLRIEQTKSRPRQSGYNGLVETKNGAIIRPNAARLWAGLPGASSASGWPHCGGALH